MGGGFSTVRVIAEAGDEGTLATNALGDPAPYRPGNDVRILERHFIKHLSAISSNT